MYEHIHIQVCLYLFYVSVCTLYICVCVCVSMTVADHSIYVCVCLCQYDWQTTLYMCVCVCASMTVADHLHSAKVHFYQLGLGAQNTVTDRGWKLMTLRSIQSKLGHSKVRPHQTTHSALTDSCVSLVTDWTASYCNCAALC